MTAKLVTIVNQLGVTATDHNSVIVTATGMVNTGGWENPRLVQRIKYVDDGILEFDFIADAPGFDEIVTQAFVSVTASVEAELTEKTSIVLVHSATNEMGTAIRVGTHEPAAEATANEASLMGKFFKSGDTSRVTKVNSASASIDEDKVYIHVQGKVNTGGWSNIRLKPKVYFVPPADGIQEITFIGEKPLDYATMALEDVSASLSMSKPDWLNGFRIIAGSNSIEVRPQSNNKRIVVERQEGDGEYWPFPWRQTAAKQ